MRLLSGVIILLLESDLAGCFAPFHSFWHDRAVVVWQLVLVVLQVVHFDLTDVCTCDGSVGFDSIARILSVRHLFRDPQHFSLVDTVSGLTKNVLFGFCEYFGYITLSVGTKSLLR